MFPFVKPGITQPTTCRLGADFRLSLTVVSGNTETAAQVSHSSPNIPTAEMAQAEPKEAEQPLNWGQYSFHHSSTSFCQQQNKWCCSDVLCILESLISSLITQILISGLVRCEPWSKVPLNSIYSSCDSLETNTVDPTFLAFISVGAQGLVSFICSAASYFWDV